MLLRRFWGCGCSTISSQGSYPLASFTSHETVLINITVDVHLLLLSYFSARSSTPGSSIKNPSRPQHHPAEDHMSALRWMISRLLRKTPPSSSRSIIPLTGSYIIPKLPFNTGHRPACLMRALHQVQGLYPAPKLLL